MKLSHSDYDWMYGAPNAEDQGNFFKWLLDLLLGKKERR